MANVNENRQTELAKTILEQLGGGGRLRAMLGVKSFVALESKAGFEGGLMFNFPNKIRSKANGVQIQYSYDDLYSITFWRINPRSAGKILETFHGIYADQLKSLIENQTGLYLSL